MRNGLTLYWLVWSLGMIDIIFSPNKYFLLFGFGLIMGNFFGWVGARYG